MLFILGALPLFSLAFVVFDRTADLRRDSAERTRAFEATWGTLYPLRAGTSEDARGSEPV